MQLYLKFFLSVLFFSVGIENTFSDTTISKIAGPWPISITSCDHDAGAICSLTWRNKEFIDDLDRGRQLQSAANYSRIAEGYNPTEAGSSIDGQFSGDIPYTGISPSPNPLISSSALMGRWATSNELSTSIKMAFWIPVPDSNGEVTYQSERYKILSNHTINKNVLIGAHGLPHVIQYLTEFIVPNETLPSNHGVFEAVTGYMPKEFSTFWTFNVHTQQLTPLSSTVEQGLPLIFSTSNGGWAMGIYSPDTPQPGLSNLGYGAFSYPNVVKWNNVFRYNNPKGKTFHFRSYVIVGSLDNVKTSMVQLRGKLDQLGL